MPAPARGTPRTTSRDCPSPTDAGRREPPALPWIAGLLIVIAGAIAFSNTLGNDFVFDDEIQIVGKQDRIDQLWPPSAFLPLRRRPVVEVTLAINYAIGGLEPRGYHVLNIAIHLAAALVLLDLLRRCARLAAPESPPTRATWFAFVVALLWAVHPLQTESVTYVIQRAESLMGLLYLLTLDSALLSAQASGRRGRLAWGALAVVACALGMGAKAVMITAPALAFILDRLFISGSWTGTLRRRWALHAALWSTLIVVVITGQARGVIAPVHLDRTAVGFGIPEVTPFGYALSQPGVLLHYLRLAVWPDVLCIDYDWPVAQTVGDVAVPGAIMIALFAATLIALRRGHWLGGAGAAFFLILAPTSSIVPIKDLAFEHRLYLPLAAVLLVLVWGTWCLLGATAGRRSPRLRAIVAGVLIGVTTGALTARTQVRNRDYATDRALWRSVVRVRPQNMRAQYNLGVAYAQEGRWDDAIAPLTTAALGMPEHFRSRMTLADALRRSGQPAAAMEPLREAIAMHPGDPRPIILTGLVLEDLGRPPDALRAYEQALAFAERFKRAELIFEALVQRGRVLGTLGRWSAAESDFRRALSLRPDDAATRALLAQAQDRTSSRAP